MPVNPATVLKRSLNLTLVSFHGIGTILGAGIYMLNGKVAGFAGMFTPVAFLLAVGLAVFSAPAYAELAARFPKCAGEAVYVPESAVQVRAFLARFNRLGDWRGGASLPRGTSAYLCRGSLCFQAQAGTMRRYELTGDRTHACLSAC